MPNHAGPARPLFEGTRSHPQRQHDPQEKACWREPQWSPTLEWNAVGCLANAHQLDRSPGEAGQPGPPRREG